MGDVIYLPGASADDATCVTVTGETVATLVAEAVAYGAMVGDGAPQNDALSFAYLVGALAADFPQVTAAAPHLFVAEA